MTKHAKKSDHLQMVDLPKTTTLEIRGGTYLGEKPVGVAIRPEPRPIGPWRS